MTLCRLHLLQKINILTPTNYFVGVFKITEKEKQKIVYVQYGDLWLKTRVVSNPQILKALTPLRWKILRLLAEKERYTAELIQLLETSEQNIYYNVNKLLELDLIELAGIKEVRGGKAKLYRCAIDSLFLPINKLREG
ncbi:MAG: ArsR/SmtB family transcription factor, partial [Promethearchaeota archaeon]